LERDANSLSLPMAAGKRVAKVAGKIFSALMLMLMAVLVFFLLQSRLAGGVPSVAGYQLYIVLSGSMSPAFETGSIVLVRPLPPSAVQVGDIITYRDAEDSDKIVTHRVMAVNQTAESLSFTTRGDANDAIDPLPLLPANLIGRVSYTIPYLGLLLSLIKTDLGLLLMIIIPGLLLIASELRSLMVCTVAIEKEKRAKEEKNEQKNEREDVVTY